MLSIDIIGNKKVSAENLVLDYNGTLAIDGFMIDGIKEILNDLSKVLSIHILTADTFGRARDELKEVICHLHIIQNGNQHLEKLKFIKTLGIKKTIVIGNGLNDSLMIKNAALGIAVMQSEGLSTIALQNADIICSCILDALELLKKPNRIIATLRK